MFKLTFFTQLLLTFVLLLQINHALSETEAEITNSQHQVSIRLLSDDKVDYGSGHICSGTLISNFTVLTSASCLLKPSGEEFYESGDLQVAMGNVNRKTKDTNTFIASVTAVKTHGRFNRKSYLNNLALLEVESVEFSPFVIPVMISEERIEASTSCFVLGWRSNTGALTDLLMRSNVETVTRDTCIKSENFPFATFCSRENSELDTCVGEDGSGLICNGWLRGVVSRNCSTGRITQYTDVSQIYNWIFLSHLKEGSLKMIDNEFLRHFVFSALDFAAYFINTPKIADDFEVLKFLF